MAVTLNAKGTSVSTFMVGKDGPTLNQNSSITVPTATDFTFNLDTDQSVIIDAGTSGPALITATDDQDLHINPAVGGGQYLVLNDVRWPAADGTNGQILSTNGAGILSWSSAGAGSVTDTSVTTANGFAGSVATSTTTPAITISTTVTGVLKGNGTAISAATPGTDYLTVLTGDVTTSGNAATLATVNSNVGQYAVTTVNAKGLVTAATDLLVTGDATGMSSGASVAVTLATVNSSPQTDTFRKVTVNGKGLVTATSAVASGDVTTALGYTPVNKVGDTMTGALTISATSPYINLDMSSPSTGYASLLLSRQGANRWQLYTPNDEAGSNSGTDFYLGRYSDAGTLIDFPISIFRSTGAVTMPGNVGIGVASGSAQLGVSASQIISGSTPYIALSADQSTTHTYIEYNTTSKAMGIVAAGNSNNGYLTFSTGGVVERMRINSSGNISVGTSSSSSSANVRLVLAGNVQPAIQLTSSSGGGMALDGLAGGGAILYTHTGATGSESFTSRLALDSNGNIGIGRTPAAGYRLDILGANNSTGIGGNTDLRVSSNNETVSTVYGWNQLASTGTYSFAIGGTSRMAITSGGIIQDGAGNELGWKNIPPSTDTWVRGGANVITTGATVGTANAGDTYSVYNNSGSSVTLTASGVTMYLGGTNTSGNRTLLPRGFATIWFRTSTECVINGNIT